MPFKLNKNKGVQLIKRFITFIPNKTGYRILKIKNNVYIYPRVEMLIRPSWYEDGFQNIYSKIKNNTVVSPNRYYLLRSFALLSFTKENDFAECGCYNRGRAYLIAEMIRSSIGKRKSHLFDTFAGMRDIAVLSRNSHPPRNFKDTSLNLVKDYLREFQFIDFHPGVIPITFKEGSSRHFCFDHIDGRSLSNDFSLLSIFLKRLVKGRLLISNDYGFKSHEHTTKAAMYVF